MKAVILCGGGGTRLWPLSREKKPKQFHRLINNYSLIQDTIRRVATVVPVQDIYISTNASFVDEIKFQLFQVPEENIITEPAKMDNSAAIALALTHLEKKGHDPLEPVIFLPADHVFENEAEMTKLLQRADEFCRKNPLQFLTFGIRPTYPATCYGYIKMTHTKIADAVFAVESFVEKPNVEKATEYASSWEYLWNLGIFCMSIQGFLELYKQYLPQTYTALQKMKDDIGTPIYDAEIKKIYPTLDKISIDYGIIEKMTNIAVMPADNLGWTDIGNFQELYHAEKKYFDADNNVKKGNVTLLDTKNSLIYGSEQKLIAVMGCEDLVIVDTEDALLIVPRAKAGDVKKLVDTIKQQNNTHYL